MRTLLNKHFPGRPLWRQLLLGLAVLLVGMVFAAWAAVYLAYRQLVDHFVEYTAAAFGIAGTLMLAFNNQWSGWGFVAYLVSNACWIAFAIKHRHPGLLVQNIAFVACGLFGAYKWLG